VTTPADIRYGFRLLCRAPAVTLIAILITAFGVGAATVVYAAVRAVLIEPFPYSHTEALVQIRADFGRGGNSRQDWVSRDDMDDVARENQSFTALREGRYRDVFCSQGALGEAHAPVEQVGQRRNAGNVLDSNHELDRFLKSRNL
jgi:hypothetical protein